MQDAKINFLTQKLTLEAADEDFDAVLDAVVKLTAEVEPDCEILRYDARAARRPPRAPNEPRGH